MHAYLYKYRYMYIKTYDSSINVLSRISFGYFTNENDVENISIMV